MYISPNAIARQARLRCIAAHAAQKQPSGQPYFTHPLAVAERLRQHRITDPQALALAYLHDVLEKTDVTREALASEFGEDLATMVEELTNRTPPGTGFEEQQRALARQAARLSDKAKLVRMADRLEHLLAKKNAPPEERRPYGQVSQALLEALRPWPSMRLADTVQRAIQACLR